MYLGIDVSKATLDAAFLPSADATKARLKLVTKCLLTPQWATSGPATDGGVAPTDGPGDADPHACPRLFRSHWHLW